MEQILKDRGYITAEEPFQKLINQGMILGTSAFVYRIEGTNTFVSKGKLEKHTVQPIHVDVAFSQYIIRVRYRRIQSVEPDFANAEFILEDSGKYIVGHEVEKMSKSKFNVVNLMILRMNTELIHCACTKCS